MATTRDNGKFYTTEQVCRILGVDRRTVQRWLVSGRLSSVGSGWNHRFDRLAIMEIAEGKGWKSKPRTSLHSEIIKDLIDGDDKAKNGNCFWEEIIQNKDFPDTIKINVLPFFKKVIPDAYKISALGKELTIYEVEVSNQLTLNKVQIYVNMLRVFDGWQLRLVCVKKDRSRFEYDLKKWQGLVENGR